MVFTKYAIVYCSKCGISHLVEWDEYYSAICNTDGVYRYTCDKCLEVQIWKN